jgi:hypothetical protein
VPTRIGTFRRPRPRCKEPVKPAHCDVIVVFLGNLDAVVLLYEHGHVKGVLLNRGHTGHCGVDVIVNPLYAVMLPRSYRVLASPVFAIACAFASSAQIALSLSATIEHHSGDEWLSVSSMCVTSGCSTRSIGE